MRKRWASCGIVNHVGTQKMNKLKATISYFELNKIRKDKWASPEEVVSMVNEILAQREPDPRLLKAIEEVNIERDWAEDCYSADDSDWALGYGRACEKILDTFYKHFPEAKDE